MPAITASAPGKIILFGEHAVVYGRPAIAVPVTQVRARAIVTPDPGGIKGSVHVQAPNIGVDAWLEDLPVEHPLRRALDGVLAQLGLTHPLACIVRITSTIPVASGLGSGAAVSVALIRAFSGFLGHILPPEVVSNLAYEVEKLHHGTPSGIDNTVITYNLPVFFIRSQPLETFTVKTPFTVVIGDTGVSSPTVLAVGDVRQSWLADPTRYESMFDAAALVTQNARAAIESGDWQQVGPLMDENHEILCQMGVSSPELNTLVQAARTAGALGAKLSGGGRGGNMIALASASNANQVAAALQAAGAVRTIVTEVR